MVDQSIQMQFDELKTAFTHADWELKLKSLTDMSVFIQENEKMLAKSKKFDQIVSILAQCMTDNNSKVVSSAQDLLYKDMNAIKYPLER